jgi:type IV fimbrial biogenesis protein FimT
VHGTVTPTATFKLESTEGVAVHQVVNVMGRTRSCVASGALPGFKTC